MDELEQLEKERNDLYDRIIEAKNQLKNKYLNYQDCLEELHRAEDDYDEWYDECNERYLYLKFGDLDESDTYL